MSTQPSSSRVLSDAQFASKSVAGGATRRASDLREVRGGVDAGYAVGGAVTRDGKSFPPKDVDASDLTPDVVRQHLAAIHGAFGKNHPDIHQGAWREGSHVVLDASEVYPDLHTAKVKAMTRGEDAIYDMKNGRDHHVKVGKGPVQRTVPASKLAKTPISRP